MNKQVQLLTFIVGISMAHTQTVPTQSFSVDLKHAIVWVARALDYVGIDDVHHNHRVAYIAYQCAKKLDWDDYHAEFAYFCGMIHDCGVSETKEHIKLLESLVPQDSQEHCIRGYHALQSCPPLTRFATPILYHHTPWQELTELDIPSFDKEVAALLYLSDRLDFLRAKYVQDCHNDIVTLHEEFIADCLREHSGTLFSPHMVTAISDLVLTDGFWFAMESYNIETIGLNFNSDCWSHQNLDIEEINALARFLARIVDAKSAFTYQHSQKVAELSRLLGEQFGMSAHDNEMLYVAGLVHDIGKLKTPDEILHKEGKLTEQEYARIKRHTVDTELALTKVFPNSKISEWASNHHERLDGSGYPYHKTAEQLDIPSRIIAVADVFQALSQDRPYRGRMSINEILPIMDDLVENNKLCAVVYETLRNNISDYYSLSSHSE